MPLPALCQFRAGGGEGGRRLLYSSHYHPSLPRGSWGRTFSSYLFSARLPPCHAIYQRGGQAK